VNGSTAIDCDIDGVPDLVVSWDLTQTVLNDGYRFVGTAVVSDLRTSKDVAYKQDYRGHYDLAPDGRSPKPATSMRSTRSRTTSSWVAGSGCCPLT
jgi:hypothetical protein